MQDPTTRTRDAVTIRRREWTPWLVGLICLLLVIALYYPALRYYFVGDDVWFIHPHDDWFRKGALPRADKWHYDPLFEVVFYALTAAAGWRAEWLHALNLVAHAAAGTLLFVLLRGMGLDRRVCWIAPLFFVSRGIHYEMVTWTTALSYLMSILLTFATLLWWDRYLESGGRRLYLAVWAGFVAALLTIEHSVVLLGLYLAYDLLMRRRFSLPVPFELHAGRWRWEGSRVRMALRASLRYLPFVLAVLAFVAVKQSAHRGLLMSSFQASPALEAPMPSGEELILRLPAERTWLGLLNTPTRAYKDLLMSTTYLFLPSNLASAAEDTWLTRRAWLLLVPWLAAHVALLWKGGARVRFLLIWIYAYVLPIAVAGVPQARYYSMSAAPAAALIAMGWVAAWDRFPLARRRGSFTVATVLLLGAVVVGEARFVRARLRDSQLASDLVRGTVERLQADLTPEIESVYFLNFPARVPGPFWGGQAFDNATEFLPRLVRPPRHDVKAHVLYDRSFVDGRWATLGTYATEGGVREAASGERALAYQFVAPEPRIVRLEAPASRAGTSTIDRSARNP